MIMMIFVTVLFVTCCVLIAIAIKQGEDDAKIEQRNKLNEELISRHTETNKAYGECLRIVIVECHGILDKCIDQQNTAQNTVQQERALSAVLTECSATLGLRSVDTVFATLEANERSYYTLNDLCQETKALWSDLSELQAKHTAEKKKTGLVSLGTTIGR